MLRISVTKFHNDQLRAFEIDYIPFELFRDYQLVWNLARKSWLPSAVERLRGGVLSHDLNCIGRRNYFGVRESIEKCANSKPMVSMTVGNVDDCQILAFGGDPICQTIGLLGCQIGVDEHTVLVSVDEG